MEKRVVLLDGPKIGWDTLRNQKLCLLNTISFLESEQMSNTAQQLTGIIHLIDYVQDQAVAAGYTEKEIFNLTEETE